MFIIFLMMKFKTETSKLKNTLFFLTIICVIFACESLNEKKIHNFANEYQKNVSTKFVPKIKVFHNEKTSHVYFKIDKRRLRFIKNLKNNKLETKLKVNLTIYSNFQKKKILINDSLLFIISQQTNRYYENSIDFKLPKSNTNCILFLKITDTQSNKSFVKSIIMDNLVKDFHQNFLLLDKNKKIIYDEFLTKEEEIFIKTKTENEKLFVSYISKPRPVAMPPFVTFVSEEKIKADSSFVLKGNNNKILLKSKGLYIFHKDSTKIKGISFFLLDEEFPNYNKINDLVEATIYITKTKEYEKLMLNKNKKLSLDQFWLSIGKNSLNSKKLIKTYYNRMFQTNRLFTSDKEGWRTDRGMIYTIFGAPTKVYKSTTVEKWVYGENTTSNIFIFEFQKNFQSSSNNSYILKRNEYMSFPWTKGFNSWRHGRIFYIN